MKPTFHIFTDGASKGNPGHAGWGAVVITPHGTTYELGGYLADATNNHMELLAVDKAIQSLGSDPGDIKVFTDSQYVINGIQSWLPKWEKNNWRTAQNKAVLNQVVWQDLAQTIQKRKALGQLSWHYVPGHRGVQGNERADTIASRHALRSHVDLYNGPSESYPIKIDLQKDLDTIELLMLANPNARGSKKKVFCYLSCLDGEVKQHKTWEECQKRIYRRPHVRFKKVYSQEHLEKVVDEWASEGLCQKNFDGKK